MPTTSNMILDQWLNRLEASTAIMKMADGRFDKAWGDGPAKGRQVAIRLPIYVSGRRGEKADAQDVEEKLVILSIPDAFGSDTYISDAALAMDLTDFDKQYIVPQVERVASDISNEACKAVFFGTHQFAGTPGIIPTSLDTYDSADRLLTQSGTPLGMGARSVLIDAAMDKKAVAAGRALFNSQPQIKDQYEQGTMGLYGGAKWSLEQHLYQHTVGLCGSSTPLVNMAGGVTDGAISVVTDGWAVSTQVLNKGDKIQFAGAKSLHPVNGRVYPDLTPFTVQDNVTSDSGGNATITLLGPHNIGAQFTGPYKTVSALPADNAAVYVWGKTATDLDAISGIGMTAGITMHKSALAFASPDLELPTDVDRLSGKTRSPKMNLGIRIWRASNVDTGRRTTRVDILCGFLVPQSQRACLIASA